MTTAFLLAAAPGLVLHGTSGSRSPLVNWFTNEAKIPLTMAPPRPSNHPFGQVPFLTDDGGVEVFESGAILMYIADKYGGDAFSTPEKRAKYAKWVVWSNAQLDGLCFGAVPGDHRVRGSSMGNTQIKAVATLEEILGKCEWLVDDQFSVADVAVGSYLNYVPVFFPNTDLSGTPNTAAYMLRCAERPAFADAFGQGHADTVKAKAQAWLARGAKGGGPQEMMKKMFG